MGIHPSFFLNTQERCRQIVEAQNEMGQSNVPAIKSHIKRSFKKFEALKLSFFEGLILRIIKFFVIIFFGDRSKINALLSADQEIKGLIQLNKKVKVLKRFTRDVDLPYVFTAGKLNKVATRYRFKGIKAEVYKQNLAHFKSYLDSNILAPAHTEALYLAHPEKVKRIIESIVDQYGGSRAQKITAKNNFDKWLELLESMQDSLGKSVFEQLVELYQKKSESYLELAKLHILKDQISSLEEEEITQATVNTLEQGVVHHLGAILPVNKNDALERVSKAIVSLTEGPLKKIDSLFTDIVNKSLREFSLFNVSVSRLAETIPETVLETPINVTMIGVEFMGFANEGGLAEAIEGMAKGLKAQQPNNRVQLIFPRYSTFQKEIDDQIKDLCPQEFTSLEGRTYQVYSLEVNGIECHFIDDPSFTLAEENPSIYGPDAITAKRRFTTFSSLAADYLKRIDTDVIHLHDWHVAGIALKLKKDDPEKWERGDVPPIVFTYHNNSRGAQGRYETGVYNYAPIIQGLIESGIATEGVNGFLEAIKIVDSVTTVSEGFGLESQQIETGEGVSFAVREAAEMGRLTGITNGSNPNRWNPEINLQGASSYGPQNTPLEIMDAKRHARQELKAWIDTEFDKKDAGFVLDLEKPIVTFIGRLDSNQKGLDKLEEAIESTLQNGGQFIVMGVLEDEPATNLLNDLQKKYQNRVLFIRDKKEKDADGDLNWFYQGNPKKHTGCGSFVRAASDFIFVPSRYEPCGLVQFEGWLFGSQAIGSDVGGLADSIIPQEKNAATFNGYLFNRDSKKEDSLAAVIVKALTSWKGKTEEEKGTIVKRIIEQGRQYSWTTSPEGYSPVEKYRFVYENAKRFAKARVGAHISKVNILSRLHKVEKQKPIVSREALESNRSEDAYLNYYYNPDRTFKNLDYMHRNLSKKSQLQMPSPYGLFCDFEVHKKLGSHIEDAGVRFSVAAPKARRVEVRLLQDDGGYKDYPMTKAKDGIWSTINLQAVEGTKYQYVVDGKIKLDPLGLSHQHDYNNPHIPCSVVFAGNHVWDDKEWMVNRVENLMQDRPASICEVQPLLWKNNEGKPLNYRELAPLLVEHCKKTGYTDIELMGIMEHPNDISWGYQVSGFFAPTGRMGTPDDFKYLVDHLHQNNISVILDWIPCHFAMDSYGLAHFDGSNMYQPSAIAQFFSMRSWAFNWGTYFFDYREKHVRNFLYSNAAYWIKEMHIDGLRVDAVRPILLSEDGNKARRFFKDLNTIIHREFPGVQMIAEDYSGDNETTTSPAIGGLGFDYKWHIGWKKHALEYFDLPVHKRKDYYQTLVKAVDSDNFHKMVLAVSHDDLHKDVKAMIEKSAGLSESEKFANLRAFYGFLMGIPGKKLLMMGTEFGDNRPWDSLYEGTEKLIDKPLEEANEQSLSCFKALNDVYKAHRPFWQHDDNSRDLNWIEKNDPEGQIHAYRRTSQQGESIACIHNFTQSEVQEFTIPIENKKLIKELEEKATRYKQKFSLPQLTDDETKELKAISRYPQFFKRFKDKYVFQALLKDGIKAKALLKKHQIKEEPVFAPQEIFNSDAVNFGGSGRGNDNIELVRDSDGLLTAYKVRVPPLSTVFIQENAV